MAVNLPDASWVCWADRVAFCASVTEVEVAWRLVARWARPPGCWWQWAARACWTACGVADGGQQEDGFHRLVGGKLGRGRVGRQSARWSAALRAALRPGSTKNTTTTSAAAISKKIPPMIPSAIKKLRLLGFFSSGGSAVGCDFSPKSSSSRSLSFSLPCALLLNVGLRSIRSLPGWPAE